MIARLKGLHFLSLTGLCAISTLLFILPFRVFLSSSPTTTKCASLTSGDIFWHFWCLTLSYEEDTNFWWQVMPGLEDALYGGIAVLSQDVFVVACFRYMSRNYIKDELVVGFQSFFPFIQMQALQKADFVNVDKTTSVWTRFTGCMFDSNFTSHAIYEDCQGAMTYRSDFLQTWHAGHQHTVRQNRRLTGLGLEHTKWRPTEVEELSNFKRWQGLDNHFKTITVAALWFEI